MHGFPFIDEFVTLQDTERETERERERESEGESESEPVRSIVRRDMKWVFGRLEDLCMGDFLTAVFGFQVD